MELILHWSNKTNFINNEGGKSAKNRVGHKSAILNQKIVLSIKRNKLDKVFKKLVTAEVESKRHFVRRDGVATIYIGGNQFTLNCRDARKFGNDLTNLLLMEQWKNKLQIDKQIIKQ